MDAISPILASNSIQAKIRANGDTHRFPSRLKTVTHTLMGSGDASYRDGFSEWGLLALGVC